MFTLIKHLLVGKNDGCFEINAGLFVYKKNWTYIKFKYKHKINKRRLALKWCTSYNDDKRIYFAKEKYFKSENNTRET